jgi:hypothetical protein
MAAQLYFAREGDAMKFHYSRRDIGDGRERVWSWKLVTDNSNALGYPVLFQSPEECLKSIEDFKAESGEIPNAEVVNDSPQP